MDIDFPLLDKTLDKIKKQINLENNKIPLIDEEQNDAEIRYLEEQNAVNLAFFNDMQKKIEELQIYVPTDVSGYSSVSGDCHPDCRSLLS